MNRKQRERLERFWLLGLLILSVLFAAPSVLWPLSPDQASSFYIAREWWQHNLIPYRDAFDPRTPGIHFMRLLAEIPFGAHAWSLRLLELVVVVASGLTVAQAAAKRRVSPVELGPVTLLVTVFYFGSVTWLHSTEAELWTAACLLSAQSIIAIDRNKRRAAIVSGLWCGSAIVLSPEAVFFAPLFFVRTLVNGLADRPEPEKAPTLVEIPAAFFIGLLQPPGFFLAYFISRGSLTPFLHSIMQHDANLIPWREALAGWHWFPLAIALVLWIPAVATRVGKEKLRALRITPMLLVCALAATIAHPTPHSFVLPLVLSAVLAADGLIWLATLWWPLPTVSALLVASYFALVSRPSAVPLSDAALLGEQLRALAQPGDQLQVSGDHAEVYATSGLASPSRFFLEPRHLPDSFWRAEHEEMLRAKPPRFFVVEEKEPLPAGYHERSRAGALKLLEK